MAPDSPPARAVPGLQQRAMTGLFWATAQRWLVRVSTLLAFVLLGRLLTPAEFGVVALAMTIISVLALATDAGFTTWLVQKRDLTDRATSTAFWISLGIGAVLTGVLAAAAGVVADALDSDELRVLLPVLSLTMVIAGASGVPAALLQRQMDFRALAVRQVTATLVSVVLAVGLALAGFGVWALVAQHMVRVVLAAVILWARSDFRPRFAFDRREAREMTGFGSKSLGVQLGNALRDQGASFLIGAVVGTVALGYWTIAGRLVNVVVELGSAAVGSVAHPVFAQLQDQRERMSSVFSRVGGAGAVVLAPSLVAMSLVSRDLVPLVFGEQWLPSASVASVLTIGMLFTGLVTFHKALLMGIGRAGTELVLTLVAVVGQVVLILALADRGLLAVATGITVWSVVQYPLRAVALRVCVGIAFRAHAQAMAVLLASGLAAAAVLAVETVVDGDGLLRMALVVLVGAAVYVPAVYVLAGPTVRDVTSSGLRAVRRRRGPSSSPAGPPGPVPSPTDDLAGAPTGALAPPPTTTTRKS